MLAREVGEERLPVSIDRIAPTRKPTTGPAGYHQWRDLTFIHWRVPTELLRPLVPADLTIDEFEGSAWIGLVPFSMQAIRPFRWLPPIPGCDRFLETNVRTYVHCEGADPGVWFFSLDAAHWLAVQAARIGWHLPYYWSRMSLQRTNVAAAASDHVGETITYTTRRNSGHHPQSRVTIRVGPPLGPSMPGTLQHFLVERYWLYAQGPRNLWKGQVHHTPYNVHAVDILEFDDQLVPATVGPLRTPLAHAVYSPGVDVEVHPLQQLP